MKKLLLLLIASLLLIPACNKQKDLTDSNIDQVVQKITERFAAENLPLAEMTVQEIGYAETKALGLKTDSGISVLIFDKNHEVFGNDMEFKDSLATYEKDEVLGEKQVQHDVTLKYTKKSVMANHEAKKREYYYIIGEDQVLKAKVTFPASMDDPQKGLNSELSAITGLFMQEL